MEDTLIHYGVKGMKWGVRRFQRRDGSLTKAGKEHYAQVQKSGGRIIKRGESIHRISDKNEMRFPKKSTYGSHTTFDNELYKYHMSLKFISEGKRRVYDNQYTNVKDLIVPSHKQQVDAFVDMYGKNKVRFNKEVVNHLGDLASESGRSREQVNNIKRFYTRRLSEITDPNEAYAYFISAYQNLPISKLYERNMKRSGYNAIVDDHDRLYNNNFDYDNGRYLLRPEDPIVVFEPNRNLRKTGVNYVSNTELKRLDDELYERARRSNVKRDTTIFK